MSAADPQPEATRIGEQYATDRSLTGDERAALAEQLRRAVREADNDRGDYASSRPTRFLGAPDIGVEPL